MEVFHLMLSNISDMQEDFNLKLHTHMLLRLKNATIMIAKMLPTVNMAAIILLLAMKQNWQKDFTMLVPSLLHSMWSEVSKTMLEVCTVSRTAATQLKMSTMQSLPRDMELRKELNSGILKILGEHLGDWKDTSKWKEMSTCAEFLNATHIL